MRRAKPEPDVRPMAVDRPIVNSPYEEPLRHWRYDKGKGPELIEGLRRAAGYWLRESARGPGGQRQLVTEENFNELELVNDLRRLVRAWRDDEYKGATRVTQQLLRHWWNADREKRLFFCQLEAAETLIYLAEVNAKERRPVSVRLDLVEDAQGQAKGYKPLRRYACKMATGSGKTVVMAMLAAWSFLNRAHYPKDPRFSDAILAVCPGLTIKERLQVLRPGAPGNYYDEFALIPPGMGDFLGSGRILITNWHEFLLVDDSKSRRVVQRGEEDEAAFSTRVLHGLGKAKNLLVINDEAHHAYRPPALTEEEADALGREERDNLEEATVWVQGLDRIHAARGINFCADFSATPFYIAGSKHEEGTPFEWIVSDFGLVDAIESGLVKIPRVPVSDTTGHAIPRYFNLWRWINDELKAEEPGAAGVGRRRPKPEAVVQRADGALKQLAGLWKQTHDHWQACGRRIPPALIIVCDNTQLSQVMYEHISGERLREGPDGRKRTAYETGQVFPELLSNSEEQQPTMRIDSRLIREAEAEVESKTRTAVGDELRRKVSTVGKEGQPGEQVRCVVSVGMLTEGWDARNVKQILGLRAFHSQLLCEQVVGRGLRRISYDVDPETGLLAEEYVDVYGVPFEVIPVKKAVEKAPTDERERTHVHAREDREQFAIEFPLVEGYVCEVQQHLTADLSRVAPVEIDALVEPTASIARPKGWAEGEAPGLEGPGETVTQTREEYYATVRMQTIEYDLAGRVTEALLAGRPGARHQLFHEALRIVREFLATKVAYHGADPKEVGLERYRRQVVERLLLAIEPDESRGEQRLLPRIERFRRKGSTRDVDFFTIRECRETRKSHVSHVVLDSTQWEASAAFWLEASDDVIAYARNDHLGFLIPYDYDEKPHLYTPDFVVRLRDGSNLIVETKGQEREQDRQKHAAAERWVSAVNNAGEWGRWRFAVCREAAELPESLAEALSSADPRAPRAPVP